MTEKSSSPIATSGNALNKLRASVLGANDGIVSTAGIVLGVAGTAASKESILVAGFAGLIAGALSMAAGEFVSVSSQRDSERAFLRGRRDHISKNHDSIAEELVEIYQAKGFTKKTAQQAAEELKEKGLLSRELEKESGIDPSDVSNPWSAAIASAISFIAGALIPLVAITFTSDELRVWATVGAVLLSLVLTGTLSARAGQANQFRAALRVVVWGIGAMAITYAIGLLVGTQLL
ncbi:MAG: VIT1/CCC1 transporter family protein [Candidatus Microsaccharimonas sp.]